MNCIYLDNAATTRVSEPCAKAALRAMTETWGNPSSLHNMGVKAELLLKDARLTVAERLGAQASEIYFTSGGTEANNLAVLGAARAKKRVGNRIIISSVEHPSVDEAATALAGEGFDIIRIKPKNGSIDPADIEKSLSDDTILLSFMLINNETGAVFPVGEISRLLKRKKSRALLHCDCVQAFGRLAVGVDALGVDLLSVSGHKIHAPKGIGALYCRKGTRLTPLVYGGGQQEKLRPGTEPLPLIAAFAEAIRQQPLAKGSDSGLRALNSRLRKGLAALPGVAINSPENAAPHILSLSTGCIKSETMLNYLSSKGICVSSGSACSKGKKSRVLTEFSIPDHIADSTIRVSLSDDNTEADADAFIEALGEGISRLARFR